MPEQLIIATFNWRNNLLPFRTSLDKKSPEVVIKYLTDYQINILGLQEAVNKKLYPIKNKLKENGYTLYGKGRFGNVGTFFPLSVSNEQTAVISNLKQTENSATIALPWTGSILPRRITKCVFDDIVFFNTHLSLLGSFVKKHQLDAVYSMINYEVNNGKKIILTGDFNMTMHNKYLLSFIEKLNNIGVKRALVNEITCPRIKAGPLDHIFLSDCFKVGESKVVDLGISDHKSIVLKVTK